MVLLTKSYQVAIPYSHQSAVGETTRLAVFLSSDAAGNNRVRMSPQTSILLDGNNQISSVLIDLVDMAVGNYYIGVMVYISSTIGLIRTELKIIEPASVQAGTSTFTYYCDIPYTLGLNVTSDGRYLANFVSLTDPYTGNVKLCRDCETIELKNGIYIARAGNRSFSDTAMYQPPSVFWDSLYTPEQYITVQGKRVTLSTHFTASTATATITEIEPRIPTWMTNVGYDINPLWARLTYGSSYNELLYYGMVLNTLYYGDINHPRDQITYDEYLYLKDAYSFRWRRI